MIDPKFKKAWIEALRSGKYKQGKAVLKQGGESFALHCCLGVACEITPDVFELNSGSKSWITRALKSRLMPFESQLKLWGLTSVQANKLADLNDGGMTFEGIAGIIERMP